MEKQGWIKIHRSVENNWISQNPEYFSAWIKILLNVNHEEKKTLIKGTLFDCYPGQSLKSLETWGKIFGRWSKSKVKRFFVLLEKDSMIEIKNEKKTTRLSVCNWLTYQETRNTDETQAKRTRNAGETQAKLNKNEKNEKNDKEGKECKEDIGKKRKRFIPPTSEDVFSYLKEIQEKDPMVRGDFSLEINNYLNYYESNGWKVGGNKMVSWKAAFRGWLTRNHAKNRTNGNRYNQTPTYESLNDTFDLFEQRLQQRGEI